MEDGNHGNHDNADDFDEEDGDDDGDACLEDENKLIEMQKTRPHS